MLLPARPEEEARATLQISIAAVLALKASDMPPEKRQLLKDLFELADDDGTGEIDAAELGELLSKLGDRMSPAEVKAMMDTVDTANPNPNPNPNPSPNPNPNPTPNPNPRWTRTAAGRSPSTSCAS